MMATASLYSNSGTQGLLRASAWPRHRRALAVLAAAGGGAGGGDDGALSAEEEAAYREFMERKRERIIQLCSESGREGVCITLTEAAAERDDWGAPTV